MQLFSRKHKANENVKPEKDIHSVKNKNKNYKKKIIQTSTFVKEKHCVNMSIKFILLELKMGKVHFFECFY